MKKVRLLISIISALVLLTEASAQILIPQDLDRLITDMKRGEGPRHTQKTYADFGGSPYLNATFVPGTIVRENGETYTNIPLRYNIYDDQIEFKHKEDLVLTIANPAEFTEINIDGAKYIYLQTSAGKGRTKGYFELLENGTVQLLKKHAVSMKEAEPAKPFKDPVPAAFVAKPATYFLLVEGEIFEIANDKSLLEALGNDEKLQLFIKEKKLKLRKEDDLKTVISYYNSL